MRGAGWISMFALARCQKTPLFFSAGDNKWRREERESEKSETDQKRNREVKGEKRWSGIWKKSQADNGNKKTLT